MSAWEFHVGQRVVCVKSRPCRWGCNDVPEVGRTYTIRSIAPATLDVGRLNIRVEEIVNKPRTYTLIDGQVRRFEIAFPADDFRPLRERKTSIECFRALLNPTEKKVDA